MTTTPAASHRLGWPLLAALGVLAVAARIRIRELPHDRLREILDEYGRGGSEGEDQTRRGSS